MIDVPAVPDRPDRRPRRLILHVGEHRTITYFGRLNDLEAIRWKALNDLAGHPTPVPNDAVLRWEWR
jgi:hypothetical protein